MGINWDKLIEERNAWVAHNFPDPTGKRTPLDSVLGCIEELGELTHHHLKQAQSIRGTDEEHIAGAKDAIGDLSVYLMGVMSHYQIIPEVIGPNAVRSLPWLAQWGDSDVLLLHLTSQVGKLALCDPEEEYVKKSTVNGIIRHLWTYCCVRGWDYDAIVQETWNAVKERDWIKYPGTGRPPVEVPS